VAANQRSRVSAALWVAALLLTLVLAVFQRLTGPSHPVRGNTVLAGGEAVSYRLPRSNEGRPELRVAIPSVGSGNRAGLEWRRYPTGEPFRRQAMIETADGRLEARIPGQPTAGKVEYRIVIEDEAGTEWIPEAGTVIARFRGDVPAAVLVPHILAMFLSMLVSTRALLEVLRPKAPPARTLVLVAMALLVVGGLVLGPIVQRFAFGAFWTGWPLGHDLTDNKTLIAFIAWLPATVLAWRRLRTRAAVALGWLVMMGVFLVPHSLRGSELDWTEVERGQGVEIDPSSR
jgi:hypothetical protein